VRRGRWEREEKGREGRAGEKASALSLLVRSIERLSARCPAALARVAERAGATSRAEKVESAKTRGGEVLARFGRRRAWRTRSRLARAGANCRYVAERARREGRARGASDERGSWGKAATRFLTSRATARERPTTTLCRKGEVYTEFYGSESERDESVMREA